MKVLIPTNTTHNIVVEPRFYPTSSLVLELRNESNNDSQEVANSYIVTDGVMTITFDLTVFEGQRFQIKVTEGNKVVYRGKAFCTDQTVQDFKLTDNVYQYAG